MKINEAQDQIIEEFASLDGNIEFAQEYLIDLGQRIPPLNPVYKVPDNLVKGCMSEVHLAAEMQGDNLVFMGDSNTRITKGLLSLLIRVLSGHRPEEIISADLYFINSIGMDRFIGTQRTGGLAAMIKQMKFYALAYKVKAEVKS